MAEGYTYDLSQTPGSAAFLQRDPGTLDFHDLQRRITELKANGMGNSPDIRDAEVTLWSKGSLPLASLVFTLIGAPLGLRPQRTPRSLGWSLAIAIIAVYYVISTATGSLARGGALPPIPRRIPARYYWVCSRWLADLEGIKLAMLENYGGVILFTVVLLAAGGLISFVGDRVGTRIGKKRLSLWGLRPRHTATLSTVISGCLIAGVTFAALMGVDGSVRRALLEGRQIVTANRLLNGQNATLRRQNAGLTATQQTAAQNADMAQQQAKDAQAQAKIAASQAKSSLQHLQASRQLLQTEQRKAQAAAKQVAQAQSQIVQARAQITKAQTQVAGIWHQRQLLLKANRLLDDINSGLTHSAADLRLSSQFIYHNGDELGRRVIDTHHSPALIYDELRHFLHDLGQQALQNHGQVGANGHAVIVFTPVQVQGKMAIVPEDESLKALAQGISERPRSISSVVVIAQAAFKTLPGEQTRIQLHPYPNPSCISERCRDCQCRNQWG